MSCQSVTLPGLALALFFSMLVLEEVGRRLGRWRAEKAPDSARAGAGVIEAAVFALLGLLLAFQFAEGAGRLERRRELIVREANAIGTAYLRLDILPANEQPTLRGLFRRYTEARIRMWDKLPDVAAVEADLAAAVEMQKEIWSRGVAASRTETGTYAPLLLLPALNDMIDVTSSRSVAARTHASVPILGLLFCVALLSSLLAGLAMAVGQRRNILHMTVFAAVTAITVYVILDLEYPRMGFIRIGPADQALVEVRQSMD